MQSLTVLLLDDEEIVRLLLKEILETLGHDVVCAENGRQALDLFQKHEFDIAILDYMLPDMNGIEVMKQLRAIYPGIVSIIITGQASIDRAVEAMQSGAWDFLTKPITVGILKEKLERISEISYLRKEQDFRRKAEAHEFQFPGTVGPSSAMHTVYEGILRSARSNLPTLIEGATGTGKEFIAQAVHMNSRRSDKPFVVLDCTATPESLIESVLFGSAKGAFTGAVERKGLLEEADGGTLFLDEIGELPLDIQPKLLRCLETKTFRPVGKTKEQQSDFRIVCATNRNLNEETKKNAFRTDLYYRISAQKIQVPPIRERPSDILILATHFINAICKENHEPVIELTPAAMQKLSSYSWPGNIRQLKFIIESAYFNRGGKHLDVCDIVLDDEEDETPAPAETVVTPKVDTTTDFKTFREQATLEAERVYLRTLLNDTDGDVRKASEIAGMTREALYRVMARCNISPKEFRN